MTSGDALELELWPVKGFEPSHLTPPHPTPPNPGVSPRTFQTRATTHVRLYWLVPRRPAVTGSESQDDAAADCANCNQINGRHRLSFFADYCLPIFSILTR